MHQQCLSKSFTDASVVYFPGLRHSVGLTCADDSESCENRNGAASALLHIDESDGVDEINRQRNKSRRRSEPRQVQTGKSNTKFMDCFIIVAQYKYCLNHNS